MTADQIQSAIALARRLFGEKHRFWAKALVDPLEEYRCTNALFWTIGLYRKALNAESLDSFREQCQARLAQAEDLARSGSISPTHCEEMALQVWNNDRLFNRFERGISRIFSALQFIAEGKVEEYKVQLISSVVMLSDKDEEGLDSTTLDMAVSDFEKIACAFDTNPGTHD